MPSLSPSPGTPAAAATMPTSPQNASGGGGGSAMRPSLMKRQSSASSHSSAIRHAVASPGSFGEQQPLRHHVKPHRHAKIILPRNHNSARNLTKLSRQAQNAHAHAAEDGRKHSRQRSHEGDTEIRLPGSLDETLRPPPIRRNMTANQLPRNSSHAKLKKNHSHGQLTRLGSARNLSALSSTAHRAPPSPSLKGKTRRPKSAEMTISDKDLHEQEVELYRQQQEQKHKSVSKKIGFAVGSSGDTSDDDEVPQMECSGLQEDEWTEESASASPFSTRQNTANNSRRASMTVEKAADRQAPAQLLDTKFSEQAGKRKGPQDRPAKIASSGSDEEPPSPRSIRPIRNRASVRAGHDDPHEGQQRAQVSAEQPIPQSTPQRMPHGDSSQGLSQQKHRTPSPQASSPVAQDFAKHPPPVSSSSKAPARSPLHKAKDYGNEEPQASDSASKAFSNPGVRRLMSKSLQLPGPALVSNVSTLDDRHSQRGSPAPSLRSTRSNLGDATTDIEQDELVSRFVPSASHPSIGSGSNNTVAGTPKQGGFQTPEAGHGFPSIKRGAGFQLGPASPSSTISGSSGATTPAAGRSRTELRLLQEKALADMESKADLKPHLPAWHYDRRNESLKSFMGQSGLADGGRNQNSGLSMGPEIFQGRFRAVNTELRVVQKFRDPLGEAIARLRNCKGSKIHRQTPPSRVQQSGLATSKSAVSFSAAHKSSNLSKSASPPKASSPLKKGQSTLQFAGGSERHKQRREVSFARDPPEMREFQAEPTAKEFAQELWNSYG